MARQNYTLRYEDPSFSTADTELGRSFAIVAVTNFARLRTGEYADRNDVIDALVDVGIANASSDLIDQILRFVNNR